MFKFFLAENASLVRDVVLPRIPTNPNATSADSPLPVSAFQLIQKTLWRAVPLTIHRTYSRIPIDGTMTTLNANIFMVHMNS